MIKIDLARTLAERLAITQDGANEVLTVFIDVVGENLEKGEKVQLAGFGGFGLRYVPEHQGRNPKTGEALTIPACHYPIFKAGKGLKDRVAKYEKTFDEETIGSEAKTAETEAIAPSAKPTRKKKGTTTTEEPVYKGSGSTSQLPV